MSLEDDFQKCLLDDCDRCTELGSKHAFIGREMIIKYGAVEASRRLIKEARAQSGFVFLMEKGDIGKEITIENRILEYPSLFNKDDIARAEFRLEKWRELKKIAR